MRKKYGDWIDWRKPRYNRSSPKLLRGKSAQKAISNLDHGPLAIDHCTRWKNPISQETFEELVERGLLSPAQIQLYNERREAEYTEKKVRTAKDKRHKHFALITEIAKHDLTTKEGLKAFQEILGRSPEALNLISEAQKLRTSNG